ncbi:hypothetical protein Bca52824_047889 [Brassica carinata]|uniref:Protein kinase domain-containing protein n=1 Tax=Brassica carinata TaxID=52824 RepID=A0A8X7UQD5_BRACI|nr:hypothetical protein Bca52824_047889 [Brassica carinata]
MKVGSSMAPSTHSNSKAMFRVADQKRVICFTHDYVLSGPEENSLPNFPRSHQRLEIMLRAAQGLAYLHELQVIYGDFKS